MAGARLIDRRDISRLERTLRRTNVDTDLLDRFRGQHPGTEPCAIDDPDLQDHPEWLEHVL